MSRSRKKTPIYTEQQFSSESTYRKRRANKVIRNLKDDEEVPKGKQYRKLYDSWNIRDWYFWSPKDKKAYRK